MYRNSALSVLCVSFPEVSPNFAGRLFFIFGLRPSMAILYHIVV